MPRAGERKPAAHGVPGTHQHTLGELETSLRKLAEIYHSHPDLRGCCRDEAIRAKDRARWASRNPKAEPAKRRLKAEMVEWMLVWLDDPGMFAAWANLRRERVGSNLQNDGQKTKP